MAVGLDDLVEYVAVNKIRLLPGEVAQMLEFEKALKAINKGISGVQSHRQGCDMLLMSCQIARGAEQSERETTADLPAVHVSILSQDIE